MKMLRKLEIIYIEHIFATAKIHYWPKWRCRWIHFASSDNQKKNNKFKNKNNQNCQKIELCRSPTTKELKNKHSFTLVGGAETGSWGGADSQQLEYQGGQGSDWQSGQSYICVEINWEEKLGSETNHTTQGSSVGK